MRLRKPLDHAPVGKGAALPLPALAAAPQAGRRALADQPLSGGHHQQRAQPSLVQDQGRHPREGERQLLPDSQQDQGAGGGAGARLYLGRGAGRPRLHRVGAGGYDQAGDLRVGGKGPHRGGGAAAHHL